MSITSLLFLSDWPVFIACSMQGGQCSFDKLHLASFSGLPSVQFLMPYGIMYTEMLICNMAINADETAHCIEETTQVYHS